MKRQTPHRSLVKFDKKLTLISEWFKNWFAIWSWFWCRWVDEGSIWFGGFCWSLYIAYIDFQNFSFTRTGLECKPCLYRTRNKNSNKWLDSDLIPRLLEISELWTFFWTNLFIIENDAYTQILRCVGVSDGEIKFLEKKYF